MMLVTVSRISTTQQGLRNLQQNIRKRQQIIEQAVLHEMDRQTSGEVTTQQLRMAGHPFGRQSTGTRRRGRQRGTMPRLPINIQSGQLRASRKVQSIGTETRIHYKSVHAWVLVPGGTRFMVARGFWTAIRRRAVRAVRNTSDIVQMSFQGVGANS